MGNAVVIRMYNVGCGDCIYVQIPGPDEGFHMLIDCGKKGGGELLQSAVVHMKDLLPSIKQSKRKRLDLLVVTHRHEDHIKGFDEAWFTGIEIGQTWLSVAQDPKHKQAQNTNKLHRLATKAMRALAESGTALSPRVEQLASMYVSNPKADQFFTKLKPTYVSNGSRGSKLGLNLPPKTEIHVLAPEMDIDGMYLGKELDRTMKGLNAGAVIARTGTAAQPPAASNTPANINGADFRTLQSRMFSNGLAFAAKDTNIQNNLSVVLLIEWNGKRLLFVGDAEYEKHEFEIGKQNGSWNVMWEKHRKGHLSKPVDFLKIGHHGSINATPPSGAARPAKQTKSPSVYEILDTILPVKKKPTAKAVVSTERSFYDPIPECEMLIDLARRVSNTSNYGSRLRKAKIDPKDIWVSAKAKRKGFYSKYEEKFLNKLQPLRTDLESVLDPAFQFAKIEIAK